MALLYPRRSPWLLYIGVLVFVVFAWISAHAIHREWQRRLGEERSETLYQLVQDKTPPRPTETPGISAWLHLALKRYAATLDRGEVMTWEDRRSVPPGLAGLRDLLATPVEPSAAEPRLVSLTNEETNLQFRAQRFAEIDGHWLVVTRRKALDTGDPASDRFLARTGPHLLRLARRVPAGISPGVRVVRVYALSEDGTLVSMPLAELTADPAARRRAALDEGREFRKVPQLPNFVSNEFFFQFDFSRPAGQVYYSGLYLDLGGQGVVATIIVPYVEDGSLGVLGTDVAFDVNWKAFARQIEAPMVAEVVRLGPLPEGRWRPWSDLENALPRQSRLSPAVTSLAQRERREGLFVAPGSAQEAVVEGQGAVAALQMAADTWLVVLFPRTGATSPVLSLGLLSVLFLFLIAGFEVHRRRAEQAQDKAERELAEKQNLLNTMQVPLLVVDPNSDAVVFGNEAARRLGIETGVRMADLVPDDERARRHYEHMQMAGPDARRAYGLPLRLNGETRYAVVRSVAVTAPIEALHADERHRLGVLFLLDPETDLALFTEDLVAGAQGEERRKLAGLLSHGVDTLVRVLARVVERGGEESFVAWLAGYVDRRVHVTAWLFDHWDAEPPLPPASAIEAGQARETLSALQRVFALAAADSRLRSSLHWDNGVLSNPPHGDIPALSLDWPPEVWFPLPVRGGFGLFLEEVLVNAIRHGRPGTVPRLAVSYDPGRAELLFEVENETSDARRLRGEPYGGRRILERLARLFGWEGLTFEDGVGTFRVSWKVPVSERGNPGDAD
jgi:PAS domain-containing protein